MRTPSSLPIGLPALPAELVAELCARLGVTLPGDEAGVGALLAAADVPSSVGLDRLRRSDGVVDFHAFVVVDGADGSTALDPIHPSGAPLLLVPGSRGAHPAYRTGVEADGLRLAHTFRQPDAGPGGGSRSGRYAILSTCLDGDDVAAFCAVSARFSGVTSHRFFHRHAEADAFVAARPDRGGGALLVERWTAAGVERVRHADPAVGLASLGYHDGALAAVEQAGFLHRLDAGAGAPRWTWREQATTADRYRAASGR